MAKAKGPRSTEDVFHKGVLSIVAADEHDERAAIMLGIPLNCFVPYYEAKDKAAQINILASRLRSIAQQDAHQRRRSPRLGEDQPQPEQFAFVQVTPKGKYEIIIALHWAAFASLKNVALLMRKKPSQLR